MLDRIALSLRDVIAASIVYSIVVPLLDQTLHRAAEI